MVTKNVDKLKWYDVKAKKSFVPKEFTVKIKGVRRYGVVKSPLTGIQSWRILGMVKSAIKPSSKTSFKTKKK